MFRKIALLLFVVALVVMIVPVSADPVAGCYVTAEPASVKEDETVTLTVKCDNIPISNNVFGFQIGTSRSGDFDTSIAPTSYTAGSFSDASTGADSGVAVGVNALSGLYAVSRVGSEVVDVESFTLGSYSLTAEDNLSALDGSIVVNLTDESFMLSNDVGQALAGWLRDVNDITVPVADIDLAWLSGNMAVSSDVTTISNIDAIELVLGSKTYSAAGIASYTNTFSMDTTYQYSEDGTPASDDTLNISVSADMTGHLACVVDPVNLGDTGSETAVSSKVGSGGTITLKSGDADDDDAIDIDDVTLIGGNINQAGTSEEDVNGDGSINILDLVHAGRNYNTLSATSCGTGS